MRRSVRNARFRSGRQEVDLPQPQLDARESLVLHEPDEVIRSIGPRRVDRADDGARAALDAAAVRRRDRRVELDALADREGAQNVGPPSRAGPAGVPSGSAGAVIDSKSSVSSSGGSMPSQTRRNAPVPSLASASSARPAIVSPSSHCIRSISNGFIRTVWGGNGQCLLCSALALTIASKFLASAPTP